MGVKKRFMKKEKVRALRRWEPASWWELVGRNGWTVLARHICQDATPRILIRDLSRNPCGDYLLHSHTEFTPAGSRTRKQGGERREKWFNQAQNEISFEFWNTHDWSGKLGYWAKWDLRQRKCGSGRTRLRRNQGWTWCLMNMLWGVDEYVARCAQS